jgi:heavy metal sensor kinase
MFKSIRWTLQLWHALLLLVVVCVFGATLYFRLRHARYQSIDAELQGAAEVLAARLRPVFPPPPWREKEPTARPTTDSAFPPPPWGRDGPGPEPRPSALSAMPSEPPRRRDGPRRGPPGEPDRGFAEELERRLEVPDTLRRRFEGDEGGVPYFAIWRSSGELVKASRPQLEVPSPGPRAGNAPSFPPQFRNRGQLREVIVPGPFGTQVLVGRSIREEQGELRQLLWLLGATGAGVMVAGLAGGWLLSNRAIRPIQTITCTAQSISASNLSRRVSLSETESELGTLAGVLNDMFARLEVAFERQVRFTADASHELRTPLSIIYSHAELALSKPRTAEEYREAIETCFRACGRMKSLIESLLVLARADAGRLEIKHEQFDLAQAAEDCAALVAPLAAERRVQLKLDLRTTGVSGDSFRIAQVITNLMTNAINYNREGGSVATAVKSEGTEAVLTVADTGVGIAEEDQKHLFERFYRVDKARSRELGGSGLGLAICKSIIEAHGGTIAFNSKINEGTTFVVRLPEARIGNRA